MNYDYDLVIIGQRPAAIAAAELALTWGARVALVMSPDRLPAAATMDYLAIAGADIVRGSYQFVSRSRRLRRSVLNLEVVEPSREGRSRLLRSRTYLIAPDARSVAPTLPGLDQTPHVLIGDRGDAQRWLHQLETLEARTPDKRPKRAIVYGGRSLISLELALTLLDRNLETRLMTTDSALLASEGQTDNSTSLFQLWQLQAIANGLECSLNSTIRRVQSVDGELCLSTDTEQFTTDVLLIADRLVPDLDLVQLQACGVTLSDRHLWVDRHLRTTHPQIYACAAALNGHDAESIATHEALTATRNALTPWFSQTPDYRAIPWGVATRGGFARVGLNPTQAQHASQAQRNDVVTIDLSVQGTSRHRCGSLAKQADSPIAVQVVLTEAGEILGATIVGDRAADLIVPFSVAIGQRASIDAWKTWAGLESTAGELGAQLHRIWRDRWWQLHPRWRDRVRSWFDDRRG